jgi:transcriptional regulator with XRE-family HTH domain
MGQVTPGAPRSPFGQLLAQLRASRGTSQLRLATEAGVSPRHLSFLETGRSQPSREMVLRLCEALDLPLRDRNALLAAAGFASLYRQTRLDAPELEPLRRVLFFLLERIDPFPALLVDRCFRVLHANRGAQRALGRFASAAPVWRENPLNALRLTLHPDGLRPYLVNFAEVAGVLVARLQRSAAIAASDADLVRLRDELLALPGLPARGVLPDLDAPAHPVLSLHLKRDGLELRLFSTLTSVGTPQDVTLQELHIESFMPADAASEAALRALAQED